VAGHHTSTDDLLVLTSPWPINHESGDESRSLRR